MSNDPIIPLSGTVTLPIRINSTSMEEGGTKFYLEVSTKGNLEISSAVSPLITIINYILVVEETAPDRWYKDKGGRSNFIDLTVRLVDHLNRLVTNRIVQLKLTLCYDNNINAIIDQGLLTLGKTMKFVIGNTGKTTVSFRIEKVSRSHQNNKFVLKIEPDIKISPRNDDIYLTRTTPIEVLSKPKPNTKTDNTLTVKNLKNHNIQNNKKRDLFQATQSELFTPTKYPVKIEGEEEFIDDDDDESNTTTCITPPTKKRRESFDQPFNNPSSTIMPLVKPTISPENRSTTEISNEMNDIHQLTSQIQNLQQM